jgi:hypothetical protein
LQRRRGATRQPRAIERAADDRQHSAPPAQIGDKPAIQRSWASNRLAAVGELRPDIGMDTRDGFTDRERLKTVASTEGVGHSEAKGQMA